MTLCGRVLVIAMWSIKMGIICLWALQAERSLSIFFLNIVWLSAVCQRFIFIFLTSRAVTKPHSRQNHFLYHYVSSVNARRNSDRHAWSIRIEWKPVNFRIVFTRFKGNFALFRSSVPLLINFIRRWPW